METYLNADWLFRARLVTDTAALVLIWLVHLVIYPAFSYAATADFRRWHPVYTRRVTYVVLPIMLAQVAVYGATLLGTETAWPVWLNAVVIAFIWGNTFLRAVPLHAALDAAPADHLPLVDRLLKVNHWRAQAWTLVWIMTVLG